MLEILHVEDNLADARLIEQHLRRHGMAVRIERVDRAESLLAALTGGRRWDAILTDYHLPALDFKLIPGWVRQHAPDCPLVLVSGSVGEEAAVEWLREGVWDFVLKENLARLTAVLERSFRDREQRLASRLLAQELEQHREHLAELVTQRTRELEDARAQAERLMHAKSEFLAHMSHEIRTPLNGVLGLAQLGWRRASGQPTQELFGGILESGQLLRALIDDILDFSRIEAGKLSLEKLPFDLSELIRRVGRASRERAQSKDIALRVEWNGNAGTGCLGDSLRVEQVVTNLLSNAIKFTHAGEVLLAAQRRAEGVLITVQDSGIGMSTDQLDRIFAPFEQADSTTTRRYGGSGLGLSITRSLVSMMGGRIEVQSRLGEGSRFTVHLPLPEVELPAMDALPSTTQASGIAPAAGRRLAGLEVLAAEDNPLNQYLLKELLQAEGASVTLAAHGREVVQRVREAPAGYDIVLMDVQMPEMDGYEATRLIHELQPSLPVVGQTAHALARDRQQCLDAGMCEHLSKPLDPELLVTTLQRHRRGARTSMASDTPPHLPAPDGQLPPELADPDVIDLRLLRRRLPPSAGIPWSLARLFVDTTRNTLMEMDAALQRGDAPALQALAHRLRSGAAAVGAMRCAEFCAQLESQGGRDAEAPLAELWRLQALVAERVSRHAPAPEGSSR